MKLNNHASHSFRRSFHIAAFGLFIPMLTGCDQYLDLKKDSSTGSDAISAQVPEPPFDITVKPGDRAAFVSWTAPNNNGGSPIIDYEIQVSSDLGVNWTEIDDGISSIDHATVTNLTVGTPYIFRVAAVNAAGRSPLSDNSVQVRPQMDGVLVGLGAKWRNLPRPYSPGSCSITADDRPVAWKTVSSGAAHLLLIKNDGTLWACGANFSGQLGDGTITQRSQAVLISSDHWTAIAGGRDHSIGIKSNGTLWVWGWRGTTSNLPNYWADENARVPSQIGTDTRWTAVAAGTSHSLGVKSDGTLWAWGSNGSSELGDGTTIGQYLPIQIGSDTDWKSVAAGYQHSIGLKQDGTLWAWGLFGRDVGERKIREQPTRISSDAWKAISAGEWRSLGIKNDGTLWAWGRLRDTWVHLPSQIGTQANWTAIAAGYTHSLGLQADGSLWAWGALAEQVPSTSQTRGVTPIPVRVGSSTQWKAISAGWETSVGLLTIDEWPMKYPIP